MKKLLVGALIAAGTTTAIAAPASAGHRHFVVIENPVHDTTTCQYVGSGQTSIDKPADGGYHRIHDNVHTGQPGTDGKGTTFDKESNIGNHDCGVIRG